MLIAGFHGKHQFLITKLTAILLVKCNSESCVFNVGQKAVINGYCIHSVAVPFFPS